MLIAIMLSVIVLNVIMLNIIVLNVMTQGGVAAVAHWNSVSKHLKD
jgi:hypothetical protein